MFEGKRVFVSGGAGVIGTALMARLHARGAKIFVGDLKPRPAGWPADVLYRQGDLNYVTSGELDTFSPEYFFHLAATFERSTETYDFWDENYHHNVNLSHHLMTILKSSRALKRVIFASSYLIYHPDQYNFLAPRESAVRLKETDQIFPRNLCGAAKLQHEVELEFLGHFKELGFGAICARIFRVYGKSSRDIVSRWIRSLLKKEEIVVYRPEGLFDYIYADEVAEGLMRLASCAARGIVNLGNDNARRVQDVLDILKRYFPDIKTRCADSDIPYEASQANMDYFRSLTGYVPGTQLEDGIPQIIAHETTRMARAENDASVGNVLVTSISRKVPMLKAIRRACLKIGNNAKLFGADVNDDCIGRHFTEVFWHMPAIAVLDIDQFIRYCKDHAIMAVIPTRDGDLPYFARHLPKLKDSGIRVMVSPYESVEACLDKVLFADKLAAMGFPTIPTSLDVGAIEASSYVVKERFGAGSRKIALNITRDRAIAYAGALESPVFQPYVSGREISVDLYVGVNGRTKGVVMRRRDLVVNGESQVTSTFRDQTIEALFSELAERLALYGHAVMQAIVDASGKVHIVECNSRFGGASTLSLAVGLDSFYWFLLECWGTDITEYPFARIPGEKKQVRHLEDLVI